MTDPEPLRILSLGGWVTMLYPTAAVCARTERIWAQVPFADVVALLEPVVLDGAR